MKEKRWGREETLSKVVFGEREGAEGRETLKHVTKHMLLVKVETWRGETLRKVLLVKEKSWRIIKVSFGTNFEGAGQ